MAGGNGSGGTGDRVEELDALQGDTCKRRKEQNPLPESGASALDRIGLVDPALLREMMQAAEKIHSRHPSIEKVAVKVVKKTRSACS